MTKKSKMINGKAGKAETLDMLVVDQFTVTSGNGVGMNEEFSLFDDHDQNEIDRYYSDKKTSWINMNFEEQLEEYVVTCTSYSFTDRHRWMSKLLYVFTMFLHVPDDQGNTYSNFMLPEWKLVCRAVGVSPRSSYNKLDLSTDHVYDRLLDVRAGGGDVGGA